MNEWCKRAVGAAVGSVFMAAVALAVFQSEVNQADLVFDAFLYLLFVTVLMVWRSWYRVAAPAAAAPTRNGGDERLLLIGGDIELSAYISVLSPHLNHGFSIAGALVPRRSCRSHTIGGVPILGEPADAAQVVQALDVNARRARGA